MNIHQIERRNLLSSFFVTLLVAAAYQEMILVVKELTRTDGLNAEIIILPAVFFFVSVRFFVGNQLHLLSEALVKLPGLAWMYDLMVIIAQCLVLVLLGGLTSIESNRISTVRFLDFLILLYSIDVVWIVTQWLIGKFIESWKRPFIPWAWAILNSALVASFYVLDQVFAHNVYTDLGLLCLLALNVLGFIIDVVLVDYYDVI